MTPRNELTVQQTFGMLHVEQCKLYLKDGLLDSPDPSLLYGLELEIENSGNLDNPRLFSVTTDGSLRNNGHEFISRPANYTTTVKGLIKFFQNNPPLRTTYNEDGTYATDSNYSDRTSIHVHTNCQDLTMKQLASMCMLYQVFERMLYAYIGAGRSQNIFCVPWSETLISNRTIRCLLAGETLKIHDWQKYTGLNLKPLERFGTIEWRHMHGTNDIQFISTWLTIIGAFYRAVRAFSFEELQSMFLSLNSNSQYERAFAKIFYDVPRFRLPGYQEMLEAGVLDLKYDWIE